MAPRLIGNKLDDAFDFSSPRLKQVKAQITSDFKNNQQDVANFLIKACDELLAMSEKEEISKTDFLATLEKIKSGIGPIMTQFRGSFDIVIKNINAEEIKYFNAYSIKKYAESDEKISDKETYLKHQLKIFEKTMDFFFDSVTGEQNEIYKKFYTENYDYFLIQQESQKDFLKKFLVLQDKKEELLDYVLRYYNNDLKVRTENYQKRYSAFEKSFAELEFNIWKSKTEKQKKYFKKNMISLKEELAALIH